MTALPCGSSTPFSGLRILSPSYHCLSVQSVITLHTCVPPRLVAAAYTKIRLAPTLRRALVCFVLTLCNVIYKNILKPVNLILKIKYPEEKSGGPRELNLLLEILVKMVHEYAPHLKALYEDGNPARQAPRRRTPGEGFA